MPYHNIQQLSDAVDGLVSAGQKEQQDLAALFLSQVQPLVSRIATLEGLVSKLQADLVAVVGGPASPKP